MFPMKILLLVYSSFLFKLPIDLELRDSWGEVGTVLALGMEILFLDAD